MRLTSADWSSSADGPAGFHTVAAVGEPQGQLHVLLDKDDGDALLVPDTPHEPARDSDHLLLAARPS